MIGWFVSATLMLVPLPVAPEPIPDSIPYLGSPAVDTAVLEVLAEDGCPEWIGLAITAGWQPQDLPRLSRIMFRESRCLPDACGETDSPHLRRCRDWGLMQINDYSWKTTIRRMGLEIEQMHDPYWNLWFARWLFETSVEANGDGWHPWRLHK